VSDPTPLDAALAERERLSTAIENTQEHLAQLERKLDAVAKTIEILTPVYRSPAPSQNLMNALEMVESSSSVTDAVRILLYAVQDKWFMPTAIRNALRSQGKLKDYKNEMAVIHQVLKRLEEQGEVKSCESTTGKVYRWNFESPPLPSVEKSQTKVPRPPNQSAGG
jgi:hypothetical protein